ncbi:MAG: ABC transporter ATP-binding protein [Clostridia bacterium]|nr:ABC transporter ATP-binding protein [Clostridia bacterium]
MKRYGFVLSNFKGRGLRYIFCLIFVAVNALLSLLPTVIIGKIVDEVLYNQDVPGINVLLWKLVIAFLIVAVTSSLMRYFSQNIIHESSEYVSKKIRTTLYDKLQTLDHTFYSHNTSGEIISQMSSDVTVIRDFFASHVYVIISDIFSLVFTFIILAYNSILVTGILLLFVPLIIIFTLILHRKTKFLHRRLRDKFSDMNAYVNENLGAYRVVKAFAREPYENSKLNKESTEYRDMAINNAKKRLIYSLPIHTLAEFIRVFVLIACGVIILLFPESGLKVGGLTVFNTLVFNIIDRVRQLSVIISSVQNFNVSVDKVTTLYDTKPDIETSDKIVSTQGKIWKIEFRDVTLIIDNHMVLDHVSFTIREGQTVAIMGPTGAGKTMLISMLLRLYDPSCGQILINNVDIRDMDLNRLRKMIALSTQDVFLFSDTIEGNIAYSNPDIPIDEVKHYAESAQAAEFIEKLTDGYNTVIGERGVGLSGGQRQRIALARAVAKKSSLVILDDTTSAVDMETESMILQELRKITGKIKIIVAQRITSAVDADKILVIEKGRITEEGTHEQLVNAGGYYTSIYNISQQGSEEANIYG